MNHKNNFFVHTKKVFKNFFKFNKKKPSLGLIADIRKSMNVFCKKVSALNDSYTQEKLLVSELTKDAELMQPSPDILSAKLEQDILTKITETSSACDTAISVGNGEEFKKHLASLEQLVKQRKRMD